MGRKKSYKIFELDYLVNKELSEDDLYYIFETPSLNYSLLVDMFKRTGQELNDEKKIINYAKTDRDWMYKVFWSKEQRKEFEDLVKKAFMNIYQCGPVEAESKTQWWILYFGLTDSELKDKKKIDRLCE